ncbi:MAG: hypothetical protein GTN62_05375 [Gemmatimonadales bacterium]|nr:hypothetical protein [Gemmatimonadales bacterium]NIN10930.1 hypothetical protein [Gemmatimonadales bacterium]NIN49528.1 hypothetical protein [Gemmatimonadales bacterium]NIP06992.1 hypothetical protein [Gemmatimonadales bacterium]NIQ99051.1 hypothetical protein [Gemmatimonadales bacterium]
MRRVLVGLWMALLAGCGLQDAFVGDGTVVARAGNHRLTLRQLADFMVMRELLPLDAPLVERWAWWWVEYSLFAQRVGAGDSLLDSASVVQARWPDVRAAMVDSMYARLAEQRLALTEATLDSAYAAGDLLPIDQILISAPASLSPEERARKRRRAEAVRARLVGGGTWAAANEANEDPGSRATGGSIGVITWGTMVPEFEQAAFALEPGEISPVTRTVYGYHIIRRPRLDEVREDYARVVEDTLYWRMRDAYTAQLVDRWEVRLEPRAPEMIRQAAEQPNRAKHSADRIGSFTGGEFTVSNFIRWLQVLPSAEHEAIRRSNDDELRDLARRVIRYDLEWLEAQNAGIVLPDSEFVRIKRRLARDIALVWGLLAVDSVRGETTSARSEDDVIATAVYGYLVRFAGLPGQVRFERVPAFLPDKLREEAEWSIRYGLMDRVLERAAELRAALDSAEAAVDTGGGRR